MIMLAIGLAIELARHYIMIGSELYSEHKASLHSVCELVCTPGPALTASGLGRALNTRHQLTCELSSVSAENRKCEGTK
jgi:hypothetical protein